MNLKAVYDKVWANAPAEYQEQVPECDGNNFQEISDIILAKQELRNEFLNGLVNNICMKVIESRIYNNPLRLLKKGGQPFGDTIEHIMVNPSIEQKYDLNSEDLLKVKKPDVKALYYRTNRKGKFDKTVSYADLKLAFRNGDEMGNLINAIVNSLWSGDNYSEYLYMRKLFETAISSGHVNVVTPYEGNMSNMTKSNKEELAYSMMEAISTYSSNFAFMSDEYNKYKDLVVAKNSSTPGFKESDITTAKTFCPLENQVLVLTTFAKNNLNLNLLAQLFNMDVVKLQQKIVYVDYLGKEVYALLIDEQFTQVRDTDPPNIESFYNPDNRTMKYILHHWQSMGYCTFCDAIAFKYKDTSETTEDTGSTGGE